MAGDIKSATMQILSLGMAVCLLLAFAGDSQARPSASIVVVSPGGGLSDTVPEGEDYFTLELGDPRDMNQRLDLRFQHPDTGYPGITNIAVENGLWRGYGGNRVFPLFCGFGDAAANLGQTGQDYPIDTQRFNYFSVRARSTEDTIVRLYYWQGAFTGNGSAGAKSLTSGGMHTLHWDASHYLPSEVAGLMLQIEGNPFAVDWVRLTDPGTSPDYTIRWTASDVSYVNIYCDTDTDPTVLDHRINSGLVDADAGVYSWKTGYLAPGTYYVYIEGSDGSAGAYSPGPLTILPAPIAEIIAPSRTSGDDYATVELGNSWDMSDSADLERENDLSPVSFSSGLMHATTVGADPYIHLSSAGKDTIETDYYKYLTWRFYVEGEWADSRQLLNGPGDRWGVTRAFVDTAGDWSLFNDVVPWEGWHIYQMDLSRGGGTFYLDDTASPTDVGWNGLASTMRLDLLEPYLDDRWPVHLDYVLLTADPRPENDETYEIEWKVLQGEPITTTVYYSSNPDASCEGSSLLWRSTDTNPQPPAGPYRVYLPLVMSGGGGSTRFVWDVSTLSPGQYYVKIELDDGFNQTCWTSDAPLVIEQ